MKDIDKKLSKDRENNKGIGQILRDEREKRGLSYAQVSEIVKLRPVILDAIEKEEWDKLPPPVFVKGFIRSYARVLDIDPEFAIDIYNKEKHSIQSPILTAQRRRRSKKWKFVLLSLMAVIAMFLLLAIFGIKKSHILKKQLKIPAHKNLSKMSTVFIDESIYFPVILKARTNGKTWLRVEIDKYKKEKYLLQPGEYISWHIKKDFKLVAGDAGCIELWVNNMPVHFDKKHGQMLSLRLYSKKHKGVNKI